MQKNLNKTNISIIIPSYNHCDDLLKPCIESIINFTELSNVEVLIVANGCKDNTKEYVENLGDPFRLIWFDDVIGFTKASNEGIKEAKGEFVILLNNDVVLLNQPKNQWIEMLAEPFNSKEKIGVSGALKLFSGAVASDFLVFFCVMIRKSLFDEIGLLDERFSPGGSEDVDFCFRAKQAGYKNVRVSNDDIDTNTFMIYHKAEATMHENLEWENVYRNGVRKLIEKDAKVAIIMPCYNDSRFLEKSINCVFDQTHKNWTLFVINDGSTDESIDVLRKLQVTSLEPPVTGRIEVINLSINTGQSVARNVALSAVMKDKSFTHVAFCDADDFWIKNHLADSLYLMDYHRAHFIYSDAEFRFEDGNVAIPYGISKSPDIFDKEKLASSNFIYISSVIMSKECIERAGYFDSKFDCVEDWDMWCRIANTGLKFFYNKNPHITYTVKEQNSGASKRSEKQLLSIRNKYQPIKLNLGCGDDIKPGYINIDINPKHDSVKRGDARFLPFADNSIDEICASHIIEHFTFKQIGVVLKEWHRALKLGGKLVLETPDAYWTYKYFVERPEMRVKLFGHLHAYPEEIGNAHFFLFTEDHLRWYLGQVGFGNMKRIDPFSWYVQDNPKELYLAMECYK